MSYYSELGIYTPSSSYTSPLLKGPYSSHSSILASNILPPSSKQFSRSNFRGFRPHLTPINESGARCGAPLRRISSPKALYDTTPKVRISRPIKINTSDIDVSVNRNNNKYEQPQSKLRTRPFEQKPTSSKKESSPVVEREAKPNTRIRRDRATIRLQTIHKDTLEKEIGQIKSWRDNFEPEELVVEAKRRKKTPGEILKEKFLIRSKSKENVTLLEPSRLTRRISIKKSPSFKDICNVITSDPVVEDLNPGQPIEVRRRQSRQLSHGDIIKEIQKSSSTLSVEEVQILDALLQAENEVGLYNTPPVIDDEPKPIKKRKVTKKKTLDNLGLDTNNNKQENNIEPSINNKIAEDDLSESPIRRRSSKRNSIQNSLSENNLLDSPVISHTRLRKDSSLIDMVKDISQVEIEMIPVKQKQLITSYIGDIEEISKPNLKAVVKDLGIEESPKQEKKEKKFRFNVTVQEFPVKKIINASKCELGNDNYGVTQIPSAQVPVITSILKKREETHVGHSEDNMEIKEKPKKKLIKSLSEVQVRTKEESTIKKSESNDSIHTFTVTVNKTRDDKNGTRTNDSPQGSGKLKIISIENSKNKVSSPSVVDNKVIGDNKVNKVIPKIDSTVIKVNSKSDIGKSDDLLKSTKKDLKADTFLSKTEIGKFKKDSINSNKPFDVKDTSNKEASLDQNILEVKVPNEKNNVDNLDLKPKNIEIDLIEEQTTNSNNFEKTTNSNLENARKSDLVKEKPVDSTDKNNKEEMLTFDQTKDDTIIVKTQNQTDILDKLNEQIKVEECVFKDIIDKIYPEEENDKITENEIPTLKVAEIMSESNVGEKSPTQENSVQSIAEGISEDLESVATETSKRKEKKKAKDSPKKRTNKLTKEQEHGSSENESNFWENQGENKYKPPKLSKLKLDQKDTRSLLQEIHDSFSQTIDEEPESPEEKEKRMMSKRSLIQKANKSDPDLRVFDPPTPPTPEPEKEPSPEPSFVPLQSNRLSQWMHPWKKPEQNECSLEIFAKPKYIRARHIPRRWRQNMPDETESENSSTSSDEDSSSENSEDETEEEEEIGAQNKVGASTSSNDSGFDSGRANNKECDVNCHKKCEKLMANLCGINQKMVVEAIEKVRKGSIDSRDSPGNTLTPASNPAFALDFNDLPEEVSQSSTYQSFQRSGRITPPATTIPRFRKYCVDDFNFLKVLGKGSFGKVLLAELKGTEYYYAVKCLKKDVVLEDDDVECTLIERKVLALGTKHPYLCHLLCTFQTESHLFFVMEYLNGGDLMFHIQAERRFSEARARFYGAEIVSGLKFLHNKGIVYRDLKLDNILLDFDGHVRIADFGMCKLQIFLDRMADTFCGTPDYMAPEIIKGQHYNQCADWWSFGVLLYEMLLGQSPFSGNDEDELFWSICNEKPVIPRFLSAEAGSVLIQFLDKDSSKRLGHRFSPHGDIQDHAFFKAIDWNALEARHLEPPFKPNLQHPLDTQYFDKTFTIEKAKLTPIETGILQSMDQTQFQGFSYTNPNATDK